LLLSNIKAVFGTFFWLINGMVLFLII
jgi:hypothetical protein